MLRQINLLDTDGRGWTIVFFEVGEGGGIGVFGFGE